MPVPIYRSYSFTHPLVRSMYSRYMCIVFLSLILLVIPGESGLVYAQDQLHEAGQEPTLPETEAWLASDQVRFIGLGLLLSLGGTLIWASVLRRRIRTQLETIQFYEDEVAILNESISAVQKTKSSIFSSIGEEIKSPLDDVLSFTSLLEDMLYEEAQLDYANSIRTRGLVLRTLVDDLMDLSQIEAGELQIEPRPFVLQKCLKEAVNIVLPRALEKELELSYSIESGVPRAIITDDKRLKQLLVNLLSNGIKFTERGSVSIHVSNSPGDSASELTFAVKDTGIGIPEEELGTIATSLKQLNTTDDFEGTGIGLAFCRRVTGLLKGQMGVESAVGKGSTFYFSIPVEETHIEDQEPAPESNTNAAFIGFVDPNRITRKIAAKFFNRLGHEIEEFNTIDSLIARLNNASFQLLFIDINEVETPHLMQALMDLNYAAENTPIIIIAENDTGENVAALTAMGVSKVISKPIQLKDLEDIVHEVQAPVQH